MSADETRRKSAPGAEARDLMGTEGAASAKDALVGKRFGNCLLQRRIGAGAMGYVYLAHHVGLNKPVAIKIMSAELIGSESNVQRFLREAQMAASLEHPNVVQVFDVGEANGLYYLAMQYVEGRSLDKHLEAKGKLGVQEANGIVKRVALALAAAHQLGIVHRDIKPANVLMSKDGQVKVADFGLARSNDSDRSLSMTGQIVGTPYYMSPEQAQGQPVDARADLYSLGATYYHLITGRRPFEGDTPISIILKHVNEAPLPPEQVEPSVPPAVGRLILKLLAKKPEDRFATGEDFVRALVSVDAAAQGAGASTSDGLAAGAERILELGGESMLDLFAPASPRPAPPPDAASPLEGPVRPAPAREGGRAPTVAISKDFKAGKDTSPEGQLKAEGKPVLGKYMLLREIQKEDEDLSIWEAENVRTKARVALRLLTGHDTDRIRAFYKLAADGTQLKHPNILHVIECHSDTDAKGRVTHYMAVELVNGLPLEAVVASRMLPLKGLLQICQQVAEALEFAHQKQRPHLTLSPREIQVEPPSRAVIAYHTFGPSQKDETLARAEALEAVAYLAPEQVPNVEAVADASTDIYRLGAILYWIVTGKPPFEASSLADAYQKILGVEPKSPRDLDPKVDPELEKIVQKALRKEKELRYAKAGELAADLRRYLKLDAKEGPASPTTRRVLKKTFKTRVQIFLKQYRKQAVAGAIVGSILLAGAVGLTVVRGRMAEASLLEELGAARIEAFQRYSEGKFDEALSSAKRAIGLYPGDEAMGNLAKKCQRKLVEAAVLAQAASLEEAAGRKAEDEYLARLGQLERSLRDLRTALGNAPTFEELSSVTAAGLGAFAAGDYASAAALLEKAVALESKDPRGGLVLARAWFARHVLADALARLLGAAGDRDPRSQEWLARVVDAVNRPTQPAREGTEADLADLYAAAGRGELERAKVLAGALLRRTPPPAAAAEALAIRAYATGADDGAGADLDASLKARPIQILAYLLRARRMADLGRYDEAAKDLAVPSKLHPNLPHLPFLRAKALHAAGDMEGALTELTRVKLQVPRDWEYREKLELLERALPERLAPPK